MATEGAIYALSGMLAEVRVWRWELVKPDIFFMLGSWFRRQGVYVEEH